MKKLCVAVLVLLALAVTPASSFYEYASGDKVGYITDLQKKGWICRTWEGQLTQGGLTDGSGAIGGRTFHFTIYKDDALVAKVRSAMERKVEVKLKYRQDAITFCSSQNDGKFFLIDIEDLSPPKKSQ